MLRFILILLFLTNLNFSALASDYSEANMLFRQSIMFYSEGSYKEATEKMQEIEKKYPDYPKIKNVMLNEMFFLLLEEKYPEAVATADSYIELYKLDSNISYVYFLKAMALHKRKKSPTKEYALVQENIDSWNEVIAHDNGHYSEEAKFRILNLQEMQALHEIKVGDLYVEKGEYLAAIRRFNNILKLKSDKYYVEAYKRLARTYKKIRIFDQAMKYQDLADKNPDYEIPQELTFKQSVKNFLYDMVPDVGFLPKWMRITS